MTQSWDKENIDVYSWDQKHKCSCHSWNLLQQFKNFVPVQNIFCWFRNKSYQRQNLTTTYSSDPTEGRRSLEVTRYRGLKGQRAPPKNVSMAALKISNIRCWALPLFKDSTVVVSPFIAKCWQSFAWRSAQLSSLFFICCACTIWHYQLP